MSTQAHESASGQPKDVMQWVAEIDRVCEEYLVKKAPFSIPENWKDMLVKVIPYLNIVGIMLALLSLPVLLGAGALVTTLGVASGATLSPLSTIWGIASLAFMLLGLVISILAAKGLFAKKASAWRLMFYYQLIGGVQNLISGNLVGMVVGLLIGLYVLYQLKSRYTN